MVARQPTIVSSGAAKLPTGQNRRAARLPASFAAMNDHPTAVAVFARLPIVGIGTSVGGLEAFEACFRAYPKDRGTALVLVPYLDPGHGSLLTEILQRSIARPSRPSSWQLRAPETQFATLVNAGTS